MTGSTILFISYALRGHAMPMIDLAEEMARRGHRVVLAMPEEGRSWIREASVEFAPWEPRLAKDRPLTQLQQQAREAASRYRCNLRGEWTVASSQVDIYVPVFRALQPLVERLRPSAIVTSHIVVPAMDLAVCSEIPLIVLTFHIPGSIRGSSVRRHEAWRSPVSWRQRLESRYWRSRLGRSLRRLGRDRRSCSDCVPIREIFRSSTTISHLTTCVEEEIPSLPGLHLVGPLAGDLQPLDPSLERWLNENRDPGVVLVVFGRFVRTHRRQLEALAAGLQGHGKQVLWVLPKSSRELLPANLSQFRFESHIDQHAVLAHPAVEAFVTHGGSHSFIESLRWGVPMLTLPFMLDQPYFASKTLELGVGVALDPHEMTADDVRRGLSDLLSNATYAENAERFSQSIRNSPGLRGAADLVESACR